MRIAAALALVVAFPASTAFTVELPDGPAARVARAAAGADLPDAAFPSWPGRLDDPGWDAVEPWVAWARLVAAEADADEPDPTRRAALALAAAAQGRNADAWRAFAACAGDPGVARAVLPHLFPGVPVGLSVHGDAPLPDGVVLTPVLPPADRPLLRGELVPSRMRATGLRVGDAVVSVTLELASDGVQVDVAHEGGGEGRLAVRLPAPEDWHVHVEYLDWERRDEPGLPHEIAVRPGEDAHSSWGRFAPKEVRWPGLADDGGPSEPRVEPVVERVREAGLVVVAPEACLARARGFALAVETVFSIDADVVELGSEAALARRDRLGEVPPAATVVTLIGDGVDELQALVGLVERAALDRSGRPGAR